MIGTPALPAGPPALPEGSELMPEQPSPITAPELAAAIGDIREALSRALGTGMAELAGALKPGTNVRDLGSDRVSIFTYEATGEAQQLIGSDPTRTKLTVIALGADLRLFANAYDRAPNGIALPKDTPIDVDTRAALYVSCGQNAPQSVAVIAHQADFYA